MKSNRLLLLLAVAGACSAGLNSPVRASHFRGGNMSASIDPNGVVTVRSETLWRKGGSQGSDFPLGGISRNFVIGGGPPEAPIIFGGGFQVLDANGDPLASTSAILGASGMVGAQLPAPNIVATTVSVDFSDPSFDVRRQEFTIDLGALGLPHGFYILYWTDTARIRGINNVTETIFTSQTSFAPFSLEAGIIFDGAARSTPAISSRVITTVAKGQLYSNNLNASGDSDLTYGFLVGSAAPRYGPTTQIPGITVDSTGQVEIPATSTATLNDVNLVGHPAGDYVFKVQITDVDGQYIEQDVLLDVVVTPNQVCTISVSDSNPTVSAGQTLVLTITAADPDVLDMLTVTDFPVVPNSTLTQSGTNAAVATYTFTPDGSQADTTIGVNFAATDDGFPPLTCVANVQIQVITNRPPECDLDLTDAQMDFLEPSPGSFVVTQGETIMVPFTGFDLDGDPLTATLTGLPGATLSPSSGAEPLVATVSWTPTAADKAGTPYVATVTFVDPFGEIASCQFTVEDVNLRPDCSGTTGAGSTLTFECDVSGAALVTLNGLATDPDDDDATLMYHWDVSVATVTLDDDNIAAPTGTFPIGMTMATLTVTDGRGGVDLCDVIIEVQDTAPPEVLCTTSVASLWPPKHNMVEVTIIVAATDACQDPEFIFPLFIFCSSDEPDNANGVGDGNTTGDVNGQDGFSAPVNILGQLTWDATALAYTGTIQLRAERDGTQDGRKYTIDVTALDSQNNAAITSCCVVVPHDRRGGQGNNN